jgi:cytochrome c oxidase accessory protein FixG
MNVTKIQSWRRFAEISQAVVIIGLPFLRIKGESALRFDVPGLELHFFGITLWMDEFFIVLIAVIFLSLMFIFITVVFGRVWCGWMCPQTVIADFTAFVERTWKKGIAGKGIAYGAVILISVMIAANLIWYFVSPYEFIPGLFDGTLGNVVWGFWAVLTVVLALNFIFLRRTFCATVCPYAKLQGTLFDDRTLLVAFDPRRVGECIECMACVKTCPVGMDIREGTNAACIHCAECIDKCATVMQPRQKKSLIGYSFGLPGSHGRRVRFSVVLTGAATAVFFTFLLYLLAARAPLDMTVLPNYSFQPRTNDHGAVVNSYILSIRNRGSDTEELQVKVKAREGRGKIVPDQVLQVAGGAMKKITIYVSLDGYSGNEPVQDIAIVIEPKTLKKRSVSKMAHFIIPGDQ